MGEEKCLAEVEAVLRKRIAGIECPSLIGCDSQRRTLHDVLHRTAVLGESNSILVIGPRGTGKSMILNQIIEDLMKEKTVKQNLLCVSLHGLLQTDDRIALKEITRQLRLENTMGDRVFGSFAETLQFLLASLKSGGQQSKPVLFILDDFDLFAHHKNQTLLYNLFDISQSAQTPVCVVGLTCRLDVIELLEKRVKSRFSHRQLYLFNDYSFTDYVGMFKSYSTLGKEFKDTIFAKKWNNKITKLIKDPSMLDVLKNLFDIDKDVRTLLHLMIIPVGRLSNTHPCVTAEDFVDSLRHKMTDAKAAVLHGLSLLELCLVIAMNHLTDIYDGEPFNFEMVYNEYRKFSQKRSSMQSFERPVLMKAFEHLLALELVMPTDGVSSKIQKEYRLMSLLIDKVQIKEALQKYPNCPTEIKEWAQHVVMM